MRWPASSRSPESIPTSRTPLGAREVVARDTEVRVPEIGDFEDVEVIEVLVAVGDPVEIEDSLITLESDKATMEIPSPVSGVVGELRVSEGDRVSEGS
ncbi:MAG: dihydrolipoamide acetyltransferase, partial [bacterium]|nr:dihydrolipoamide acetyltransferase [bacterium]